MPLFSTLNRVDISNRPGDNYSPPPPIWASPLNENGESGRFVLSEFSQFSNIYFEHSTYYFKSILGSKLVFINTVEWKFRLSNVFFNLKINRYSMK